MNNHVIIRIITAAILLVYLLGVRANAAEPFCDTQQLYEGSRLVNVVVHNDGTVLAFHGRNIPLVVKRSMDGGNTWGEAIRVSEGDAILAGSLVDEGTGDILVFDVTNTLYRSRDVGLTWEKQDTRIEPDRFGNVAFTQGSDSGTTIRHGEHKGRLILPARVNPIADWNTSPYGYSTAIFSDDGGVSWHTSHPFPVLGTGESALVELSDGRLYDNSRCHTATDSKRRIAWSHDGGLTWVNPSTVDLPDGTRRSSYGCMGGMARLDVPGADILLFSNLDCEGGPSRGEDRRNITVWASFDGGITWPAHRRVFDGPSAYSSMAAGRPGTPSEGYIYLLYEGGANDQYEGVHVARFNLDWVTSGEYWQSYVDK